MLAIILAINLFSVSSDTMEVKGMKDIYYRVFASNNNIYFQYKAGKYLSMPTILDSGNCYSPSIAVTPGDYLHVVWQRDIEDGKIFYKTTLEKVHPDDIRHDILPSWSEPFEISEPGYTAPASNPSTEAYGEYVYAAWRGPNEQGNPEFGDIWRRPRWLGDPYNVWRDPENKSRTLKQESNYPVMSTDFVTVWQEQDENNWNIWARFEPEQSARPIFETPTPSKYPHINGYWDPNPAVPPTFCCNTIWTEEIASEIYEVKFDCYRYEYNPHPEEKVGLYYTVEIGDSIPSPYCNQRDGYFSYGQYAIDYGNQKLKYKLPYLHPSYYYDLRAIIYQQGQDNWSQEFDIDSALTTTVTFEPNRPETIWIRLPQQSYMNDAKVKQEIKKILGNRAVIADLRLYQVEEFDSTGGGSGPQSAGSALIQRPFLYQSYPNPAKTRTVIRYSLPIKGKVSLTIYDISGRAVRKLIDENKEPGLYTITWNGKDDRDRTLAQGVYFYCLKSNGFTDTKRMVLIK